MLEYSKAPADGRRLSTSMVVQRSTVSRGKGRQATADWRWSCAFSASEPNPSSHLAANSGPGSRQVWYPLLAALANPCPPGPLNPKPEDACKLPLFSAQRTNRFSDPCETKKGTFKKQIPLLPTSCSFTQQTLNHMCRLDSPSVSAETLKP